MKFDSTEFLILLATIAKDIEMAESFKKGIDIVVNEDELSKAEKMYEDIR